MLKFELPGFDFNILSIFNFLCLHQHSVLIPSSFKINEPSEDSYLGLIGFFFSVKIRKVSNSYRYAFIHFYAFLNALRYICLF